MKRLMMAGATRVRMGSLDETGFTLIEFAVSILLVSTLFVMSVPIMTTLLSTQEKTNNTYSNSNQVLPVSTVFKQLIRSAVSPGPMAGGVPIPAFGDGVNTPGPTGHNPTPALTPTAMWFTTNLGIHSAATSWCSGTTGTCLGPVLVHAYCTPNSTNTNVCSSSGASLTVAETLPDSDSCPGVTAGSACTYRVNAARTVVSIANLANGANSVVPFQYELSVPNNSSPNTDTLVPAQTTGAAPSFITASTTNSTMNVSPDSGLSMFGVCQAGPGYTSTTPSSTPDANCPSDEITAVGIDVQVQVGTGTETGGQTEDSTVVYLLSPQSSTYEPEVG
jgi:hypothetical protein